VPAPGDQILVDGSPVGAISHAVWSPTLDRTIGTARVDRAVAAAGLDFTLADPAHRIQTVSAPFLVATSFGVPLE
jgi:glycine cleavage system aminomethyltransferase T